MPRRTRQCPKRLAQPWPQEKYFITEKKLILESQKISKNLLDHTTSGMERGDASALPAHSAPGGACLLSARRQEHPRRLHPSLVLPLGHLGRLRPEPA